MKATERADYTLEISCLYNFLNPVCIFMHAPKNDVSADVFPAQRRCNPGDAAADIAVTSQLSGEHKTMTREIP